MVVKSTLFTLMTLMMLMALMTPVMAEEWNLEQMEKYKNIRIHCSQDLEECEAKKAIDRGLINIKTTQYPNGGTNPASDLCARTGGNSTTMTFKGKNGGDQSICRYKDGSAALAWDLLHLVEIKSEAKAKAKVKRKVKVK